jgi:IS5 family transposase
VTGANKRRAAIEPVIGHLKQDQPMGRNFLAHRQGDAINNESEKRL